MPDVSNMTSVSNPVMIVMETVIITRGCRYSDVTRCDAIAAAQEEAEEHTDSPETLDGILVEPPPETQVLSKIPKPVQNSLNSITTPPLELLTERGRRGRDVGVLTVVDHR